MSYNISAAARWVLALIMVWLLAGCQRSPAAQSAATPEIITVQVPPALQWTGIYSNACAVQVGGLAVIYEIAPNSDLADGPADLALQWGVPENAAGEYTYQIGSDDLVIIVHPENPVQNLLLADLQRLYGGSAGWDVLGGPADRSVELWEYPQGDQIQHIFEQGVGLTPRPAANLWVAPDPLAMKEAVNSSPGAVGFLPRRWLDDSVKAVALDDAPANRFREPVVAAARQEPAGKLRDWLGCMQENLQ